MANSNRNRNFIDGREILGLSHRAERADCYCPTAPENQSKNGLWKLFPTQRHADFLIVPKKNDMAILNRLNRNLIDLIAQLQSKLLALSHRSAIDDSVALFGIECDRGNDKRRWGNCRASVLRSRLGEFRSWLKTDRPERIALAWLDVEGGFALQFKGRALIRHRNTGATQEAKVNECLHFLSMTVAALKTISCVSGFSVAA